MGGGRKTAAFLLAGVWTGRSRTVPLQRARLPLTGPHRTALPR